MSSQQSTKEQSLFSNVYHALRIAIPFGIVVVMVYGLQAKTWAEFCGIIATGLLLGAAAFGGGGFFGFLFSLPRMAEKNAPSERTGLSEAQDDLAKFPAKGSPNWIRNNNLVDVSDWLTKILIGAGLVQLSSIATGLQNLGQSLAPALGGFPSSAAFAIGILLYSTACGFLALYLWNVLVLPQLIDESERQRMAEERELGWSEGQKVGVQQEKEASELEKTGVPPYSMEGIGVAKSVQLGADKFALWVDDVPGNNERLQAVLAGNLGLGFTNVLSTEEALNILRKEGKKYCLVISDMGRPGDPRAGYTLLAKLRDQEKNPIPYIIYAGSGLPEHDAQARQRGAVGSTNSPKRLSEMIINVLRGCDDPTPSS